MAIAPRPKRPADGLASPDAKSTKREPGTAARDGRTKQAKTSDSAAVPTLGGYEFNEDGTATGFIYGSTAFRDGESVTTSVVASRTEQAVETESGSRYALGVRAPTPAEAPLGPTTVAVVGNGDCGQLGFGSDLLEAMKPRRCPFFEGKRIVSIACGGMHTAAVGAEGELFTWGCNDDGALGRAGDEEVPMVVAGGALATHRVAAVACGDSVTTALCVGGRVCSWGTYKDAGGALGFSEATVVQHEPLLLEGLPTVRVVACGANHTVAVTMRGQLYAWGCGEQGQLGCKVLASRPKAKLLPTQPLPLRRGRGAALPVVSCGAGAYHSLAITADGGVWAFGLNNHGQLGVGGTGGAAAPVRVRALDDLRVEACDGGEHHSLVRTADGEVWGFGRADSNQLGLGDDAMAEEGGDGARETPVRVSGLDGVRVASVVCGSNHCGAVTAEGDLYTWGFGEMYQLGHGEADDEAAPRRVDAVKGRLTQMGAGGQHSVLLLKPKP